MAHLVWTNTVWQVFYDLLHKVLQWMQKIGNISPSIKDKTKMCYTVHKQSYQKISIILLPMPQNWSPIIISHCFTLFAYISYKNYDQENRMKIKKVFWQDSEVQIADLFVHSTLSLTSLITFLDYLIIPQL